MRSIYIVFAEFGQELVVAESPEEAQEYVTEKGDILYCQRIGTGQKGIVRLSP